MPRGDAYDKLMRELRQAGISRSAAEAIANRLVPASPDGTRHELVVADDGALGTRPA